MPKTRSGLGERQQESNREIRSPEDLYDYFERASDAEADQMLDRWRNETLDADNRQQDNDLQRFFNYIGWANDTPEVLSESQYQQALKDAGNPTQFYHADKDYGGVKADEFARQFMGRGYDFAGNQYRHFLSGGIYGDGTYFASSAAGSAPYGTNQFRGFLNSNARVVTVRQLDRELRAFENSHPAFTKMLNKMTSGYDSYGGDRDGLRSLFAAMRGYNVIDNEAGYIAVLNRKAVTVSHVRKPVRPRMNNW